MVFGLLDDIKRDTNPYRHWWSLGWNLIEFWYNR
jgi:hypothetical protein